ncbi:MAG: pantetheine-phosphate adenylyltransferase [Thaumarchaeota archaeon]|nr:pantetheine-phosphate adenylyltransferase [Nitrososphaerota archaeon]
MAGFRSVAVGGTFDGVHSGHRALLRKSFEVGERVLIGVTTDRFVTELGKAPSKSFEERVSELKSFIEDAFPNREYMIQPLNDFFGPLFFTEEVEAIVVSDETLSRVGLANRLRIEKGLKPVETIVIDRVLAQDDKPVSSTRIRHGEIDSEGRLLEK